MKHPLETNRLQLEEITPDHLELFFKLHSCPEVDEFNTMGIPTSTETTAEILKPALDDQLNETRSKYCWAVYRKSDGVFIGEAGFSNSGPKYKCGGMHYLLMPEQWGQGYATEIAKGLIEFGFMELNLHRIEAGVATENLASIRVMEKAGMQREGRRRKILPIRGEWVDNYHYAILESDPRN